MDEFALILKHFSSLGAARGEVVLGVGDDAAVLKPRSGQQLVVCVDTLVSGVHFDARAQPGDIAWKALAVNLSDLAAMGAAPVAFLLALSLEREHAVPEWLEDFAAALSELALQSDCALIGGDTTRGPLTVSVTALGEVPDGMALRRTGARAGDLIAVSGTLGDAACALQNDAAGPTLSARLHRPSPRVALGQLLRGRASACIDVSDGFAADLSKLLAASACGARVQAQNLPASDAFLRQCPPSLCLLTQASGGDDYELCFTIAETDLREVRELSSERISVVGEVTTGSELDFVDANGDKIAATFPGYDHFRHEQ